MLRSKKGSIYRVVLGCFIILAFCFALIWPQYSKRHNAKELSKAADLGRALAFAEESYKQNTGSYTAQFEKLNLSLTCPMVAQGSQMKLVCSNYTYRLEGDRTIKVEHKHLPLWLEVDIATGNTECKYQDNDWAGQDLCARMQ